MTAGSQEGQRRQDATAENLSWEVPEHHFCLLGKVSSSDSPGSREVRIDFTSWWEEDLVHKGMKNLSVATFINNLP